MRVTKERWTYREKIPGRVLIFQLKCEIRDVS